MCNKGLFSIYMYKIYAKAVESPLVPFSKTESEIYLLSFIEILVQSNLC